MSSCRLLLLRRGISSTKRSISLASVSTTPLAASLPFHHHHHHHLGHHHQPHYRVLHNTASMSTTTAAAAANTSNNSAATASSSPPNGTSTTHFPHDASLPGEHFEIRQTAASEDYTPDASKSLPLSPARQRLLDDVIALYSCAPTVERVRRYAADCVYDDQFVYANDRYKMAGQWFALPKLFNMSKNEGYQVVVNDRDLIQFRNAQSWTFKIIPKTATINALVSLSLDPSTVDSDFIQIKYHKDQANDKDYSHEGLGFTFKKWQADQVAKHMDSPEVEAFAADKSAGKEAPRKYGSGKSEGSAPEKDL